jgi:predicted metal-dependent HD superfamily phosphohydrolase
MGKPNYTDEETVHQFVVPDLRVRWERLWIDSAAQHAFADLVKAYTAPSRHYHNVHHIRSCLKQASAMSHAFADYPAVVATIFFHDAVYDVTRSDNEERSAELAECHLRAMGQSDAFVAVIRELIVDTRHQSPPATTDGRFLVDIDLAILGAAPDEFDAYEQAIRREYAHVPDEAFASGRARILRGFLAREWIYATKLFRERYETAARENLRRSLARLEACGGKMPG